MSVKDRQCDIPDNSMLGVMLWCSACKQTKPSNDFYKDRQRKTGHAIHCRMCIARLRVERGYAARHVARSKQYYLDNTNGYRDRQKMLARKRTPEQKRAQDLWKNYRMTLDDFERLLVEQQGVCMICQQTPNRDKDKPARGWHVDHDHKTGTVRGILCGMCNVGIGCFKDSPEILSSAIRYLGGSFVG